MKKLYQLLSGLSIVLLASCDFFGPAHDRITYGMIPDNLEEYYRFPVGSWWIYKDSITGIEDSFAVEEWYQRFDTHVSGRYDNGSSRELSTFVFYQYHGGHRIDSVEWAWTLTPSGAYVEYINKRGNPDYRGGADFPKPPITDSFAGGANSPNCSYPCKIEAISSYTVAGNNYSNVFRAYHMQGCSANFPDTTDDFYFSAPAGLIKVRLNNTRMHNIWELQRYHIPGKK